MHQISRGVLAQDRRSIARAISLAERQDPQALEILDDLYPSTGRAHILGVTGSPGTGKSTLVGALAEHQRKQGLQVGILAVDPSSPFSGGALLGDRIRMARASEDPQIYIRSMASRGELGGLAPATYTAAQILDAAGFDHVLIETVGTGQAEIDIVQIAQTTLVVLIPGSGDEVQVFKAGIMEIADLYVINKADRDGVTRLEASIASLLELSPPQAWTPPVVRTIASRNEGLDALSRAIATHRQALQSDLGAQRQRQAARHLVRRSLSETLGRTVLAAAQASGELDRLLERVDQRQISPLRAAQILAHPQV